MPERVRRVAVPLLVAALFAGTAAAFAVTEALKLERSPVVKPRFTPQFTPGCRDCRPRRAIVSFRLRRADRVDVAIVSDGDAVRTLVSDGRFRKGRLRFRWNGKDDAGDIVPAGAYRVRVHVDGDDRTVVFGDEIHVVAQAAG